MKLKQILVAVSAVTLLASCSNRLADLTIASTKNMDINNHKGYTTTVNARTRGEDKKHIIFFIPTGKPNMKEAIDKAIERNGTNCVGLTNATITENWFYIPLLYGQHWLVAEGDPIYVK